LKENYKQKLVLNMHLFHAKADTTDTKKI